MSDVEDDPFEDIEIAIQLQPTSAEVSALVKQTFADQEILTSNAFTGTEIMTIVVSATKKSVGKVLQFFAQYRQSFKDATVKIGPKEISLKGYTMEEVIGFFESEGVQKALTEMKVKQISKK